MQKIETLKERKARIAEKLREKEGLEKLKKILSIERNEKLDVVFANAMPEYRQMMEEKRQRREKLNRSPFVDFY